MHFYAGIVQCSKQGLLSVMFFLQFLKVLPLLTQNILSSFFLTLVRVAGATVLGWDHQMLGVNHYDV